MNIEEIKAREQAATTGEWLYDDNGNVIAYAPVRIVIAKCKSKTDADFIAHARTDIPELLAEVERLTTENATLTDTARQNCCKFVRQQEENAALKEDKEFCLNTAKCNAEFYDDAKKEIAILIKALEMACELLTNYTCFKSKGALYDYFIQQAQEAEK